MPTSDAKGALVQIKVPGIDYLDIYQCKGAYREHQYYPLRRAVA